MSLPDCSECHTTKQVLAQQEGEDRYGQQEQEGPGRDRGAVRDTRAELRWNEGRGGLRAAVGHHQREGILVPGRDETEPGRGGNAGGRLRQHYLEERFHARVAINQRGLFVLLRDLV